MTDRVFILGAGRAGRGLARALATSGVAIAGLHGRRGERTPDVVMAGPLPPLSAITAMIVAVRDAQLEDALAEVASASPRPDLVVLHMSGSAEPRGLGVLRERGIACGTFHPLVPLADPAKAAELFRGAWVGVDGDDAARSTSARLATALGARTLGIPPGQKARYHAAAVLASNFPTVLATLAALLLADTGVPAPDAWDAVRRLMQAAVVNLDTDDPLAALTGPVARGDGDTVRRHLTALREAPELARVYHELSRAAVEMARARGADVSDVERALAGR